MEQTLCASQSGPVRYVFAEGDDYRESDEEHHTRTKTTCVLLNCFKEDHSKKENEHGHVDCSQGGDSGYSLLPYKVGRAVT
jgi:hypothetical protein